MPNLQFFAADLAADGTLETLTSFTEWGTDDNITIAGGEIVPVNTYRDINVLEADITADGCQVRRRCAHAGARFPCTRDDSSRLPPSPLQFVFHVLDAVLIPNAVEEAPEPEAELGGPTVVGEGDVCSGGGLGPEFATVCADGLECVLDSPGLVGGPGVCVTAAPEPEP